MQKILTIVISCLLVSCASLTGKQSKVYEQLLAWDKILYEKPQTILDSLTSIDSAVLSKKNLAYYNLLKVIARQKSDYYSQFFIPLSYKYDYINKEKSIISYSADWFKERNDYRNLCRSLLYRSLIFSDSDSLSYLNLKEAERIYYKYKVDDPDFESQIYTSLGRAVMHNMFLKLNKHEIVHVDINQVLKQSEEYFKKSIENNIRLKNSRELQVASLELYMIYIKQGKENEAFSILDTFPDSDNLSPSIEYKLLRAYESYYLLKKDNGKAIEYLKRTLLIKDRKEMNRFFLPDIYRSIAFHYKEIKKLDSAVYYSKLALASSKELLKSTHGEESNLARNYAENGDFKSAYEHSKAAYSSIALFLTKRFHAQTDEIRNNYDLSQKELLLVKTSRKNAFLLAYVSLFFLFICLAGSFISLRKRGRIHRIAKESSEEHISSMDTNRNKIWLLNEILMVTAGLMPQFIEDISVEATRSKKVSKEVYDSLNYSVDNLRITCKNKLSDIAKGEKFLSSNPELEHLTDLSSYEKLILVLINYGYSSREIAEMLTVAPSNIRSIKAKIKEKIMNAINLPYDPYVTFSLFNKDKNHNS